MKNVIRDFSAWLRLFIGKVQNTYCDFARHKHMMHLGVRCRRTRPLFLGLTTRGRALLSNSIICPRMICGTLLQENVANKLFWDWKVRFSIFIFPCLDNILIRVNGNGNDNTSKSKPFLIVLFQNKTRSTQIVKYDSRDTEDTKNVPGSSVRLAAVTQPPATVVEERKIINQFNFQWRRFSMQSLTLARKQKGKFVVGRRSTSCSSYDTRLRIRWLLTSARNSLSVPKYTFYFSIWIICFRGPLYGTWFFFSWSDPLERKSFKRVNCVLFKGRIKKIGWHVFWKVGQVEVVWSSKIFFWPRPFF